jgi:hypothetical protein
MRGLFTAGSDKLGNQANTILKTTLKGKQIDIALLDFSKTFDKVLHQRFNNRLNLFGIHDILQRIQVSKTGR